MSISKSIKRPMKKLQGPSLTRRPVTLGIPLEKINWRDHEGNVIEYYTVILKDQAYVYKPAENQRFVAHTDNMGDHGENWVLVVDPDGTELSRLSTRNVNFVQWLFEKEE